MISRNVAGRPSTPPTNGTRKLPPQQALLLAVMMRDHNGAAAAIVAGAEPMALMRAAVEARQGHVDFLLGYVGSDRKEYVVTMAAHLERFSKYPVALESFKAWVATH